MLLWGSGICACGLNGSGTCHMCCVRAAACALTAQRRSAACRELGALMLKAI